MCRPSPPSLPETVVSVGGMLKVGQEVSVVGKNLKNLIIFTGPASWLLKYLTEQHFIVFESESVHPISSARRFPDRLVTNRRQPRQMKPPPIKSTEPSIDGSTERARDRGGGGNRLNSLARGKVFIRTLNPLIHSCGPEQMVRCP